MESQGMNAQPTADLRHLQDTPSTYLSAGTHATGNDLNARAKSNLLPPPSLPCPLLMGLRARFGLALQPGVAFAPHSLALSAGRPLSCCCTPQRLLRPGTALDGSLHEPFHAL